MNRRRYGNALIGLSIRTLKFVAEVWIDLHSRLCTIKLSNVKDHDIPASEERNELGEILSASYRLR